MWSAWPWSVNVRIKLTITGQASIQGVAGVLWRKLHCHYLGSVLCKLLSNFPLVFLFEDPHLNTAWLQRKHGPESCAHPRRRNVVAEEVEELKTVTYVTPPMEERKTSKKAVHMCIKDLSSSF